MTTEKNKTMILGVLMLLSAVVWGGSPALAASNTNSTNDTKDVCADIESADDEQDVTDDNTAADENDAEDICEKAESAKLATQVDISEAKARQIAEAGYTGNGKITELLLAKDEDDNNVSRVVYEIEFTETDGTQVDVKVDANTGKYLGIDAEDNKDGEQDEDGATVNNEKSSDIRGLQMQLMGLLQQLIALLRAQ